MRTLAADARWQRLITHHGVPIHLGRLMNPGTAPDTPQSLRYTPSERLAALVRTRDFSCPFPGCTSPAATADLDHVIPFNKIHPHHGGRTVAANLACLCRWHHRAKTDRVWNATMDPDATQHWTGPHDQHLHSVPGGMPPTGHGPPGTAAPVLPPKPGTPARVVAPDDDPPDDHPPDRFTPDGHWAEDPFTGADLDALEALIDADQHQHTRVVGAAATPAQRPPPPPVARTDPDDDPPPF
ncbi:MAG: HNH endonuclease signature motif containing protein [Mycobacteriaceae bacterium]